MKIIYTAIFNGYDLPRPEDPTPGWKRFLFTDQPCEVEGWTTVVVPNEEKIYRKIKIMPHLFLPPEHTVSIWHDGNLKMVALPDFAADQGGYWLMRHPERNCIYKEAYACFKLRKDDPMVIEAQMERYRQDRYPENIGNDGLAATGMIVRQNMEQYHAHAQLWWDEVRKGSVRDQLSFPYAAWKTGLQYKLFPFMYGLKWTPHVKNRYNQYPNPPVRP